MMNKLLIFVFVAVTVGNQDEIVEPLPTLRLLRQRIQKELDDLKEFKNDSIPSIKSSMEDFKITSLEVINSKVNQAVNHIWNMTTGIISRGKNYCRSKMRVQLEEKISTAISKLNECIDDKQGFKVIRNIDLQLKKGHYLLTKLNGIEDYCRSADDIKFCVALKLLTLNLSLDIFELSGRELRNTTLTDSLKRIESLKFCSQQSQIAFNFAISDVNKDIAYCIAFPVYWSNREIDEI